MRSPAWLAVVTLATAGPVALAETSGQWARQERKESVKGAELFKFDLDLLGCDDAGCSLEAEIGPEIIKRMREGGGIVALGINSAFKPIGFAIPLGGTCGTAGPSTC